MQEQPTPGLSKQRGHGENSAENGFAQRCDCGLLNMRPGACRPLWVENSGTEIGNSSRSIGSAVLPLRSSEDYVLAGATCQTIIGRHILKRIPNWGLFWRGGQPGGWQVDFWKNHGPRISIPTRGSKWPGTGAGARWEQDPRICGSSPARRGYGKKWLTWPSKLTHQFCLARSPIRAKRSSESWHKPRC